MEERRQKSRRDAEEHLALFHRLSPRGEEIDRELSQTGLAILGAVFGKAGDGVSVTEAVNRMRTKNIALQEERRKLLLSLGFPGNFTDVNPVCPLCRDEGYTDKGMCGCMRKLLVEEGYRSSGLGSLPDRQGFDNFSLSFYKGYESAMAKTLDTARRFAEDFDTTHANLLFIGGTGLGKTHLSTAIARRAIERGFDVVYETTQNIISDFEYDRFKSGYGTEAEKSKRYFDADLLIMDDLGAELTNQFTVASLYNVLNTRLNQGKSIVISTNLGQQGLVERYDERIASRLFGEFYPFLFRGVDVRRQKP
ncbi:MAG: ATP-binding protein [Clostridia bacterium]|nr:ATP-binding protein [Clostridia bacterium]